MIVATSGLQILDVRLLSQISLPIISRHQQKQYMLCNMYTKLPVYLPHKKVSCEKKLTSIEEPRASSWGNSGDEFVLLGDLNAWNNDCVLFKRLKLSERPSDNYLGNRLGVDTGKEI